MSAIELKPQTTMSISMPAIDIMRKNTVIAMIKSIYKRNAIIQQRIKTKLNRRER